MWGSYIGAVLYPILIIILANVFRIDEEYLLTPIYPFLLLVGKITNIFFNCSDACWSVGISLATLIGLILMGFLLGWGIHSLIRKLRR